MSYICEFAYEAVDTLSNIEITNISYEHYSEVFEE